MIVTRLLGGLGNQMFQYASAYAVAKHNNTDLAIDASWFVLSNSVVTPFKYELGCFTIRYELIEHDSYVPVDTIRYGLRSRLGIGKRQLLDYKEKGLPFEPNVFKAGPDLVMDGYWQSEQYFLNIQDDIRSEFTFKEIPSGQNKEFSDSILATNAVSVHVRRGDYANHAQTNSVHGLMGLDYYKKAIDSISKRVKNPHFFVFSDEPEWCQENLSIDQPHTYISGNKEGRYDMQLMTLCKHHIIANSSFSWWGAWLNPNKDKIIIAPKKWFNDTALNAKDLVPGSWERI